MNGMVYLVGAGPGDYRLITLKGKECLEKADVVICDYLADKRLLAFAPENVEYIYVGKKAGNHAMRQEDISQLIADKAKEGKCVVRLKGGDPFVFGRGGEEAEVLKNNGVKFEIVPGVTSAIAAPAYAGIPVTNRKVAVSFAVVTGHEDPTKGKSDINWEKLSTAVDTLVFLMGVGNLPHITSQLIKYGRSADTPAALVRWGTKAQQEVLITTVGKAAEDVIKHNLKPPAVFVVGNVVNLRSTIQWFDNKPLFGKNILITRARSQASKLTTALEELGANCIEAPAIKIAPPDDNYVSLDNAITKIHDYDWIIFTSTNGVERFFARLNEKNLDARCLSNAKIAAIGTATADKLKNYGIIADKIPTMFKAEGILEVLQNDIQKGSKVLIPRAQKAREALPIGLRQMGAIVDVAETYCTKMADTNKDDIKDLLKNNQIDMVTFTSSSTVENLLKLIDGEKTLLNNVKTAVIGPITAKTCKNNGLKVDIEADVYTIDGLVNKIKNF
ncbi:uroporphyrinogen-III C-methyltransferase [Megamonas hypermegale]|uniref:uroporphyrinogen-III C-methyltransferase n=1 Tax=Megamonas hypermegale TaxID=158847 RepID=UPI00195843B4|nr:uroporphyrinogen-III C-methyltransferase [Megamonas hypermegale]MBM6761626.1 uroporphyrinogen-III C-methyltransferase [Megamonas hypermegale]MBM6832737.1 uroporphyrinogen-III C-methyltransferase [Megamonas hypermegale]HJG07177.1 uroporphyrinogen-III C-methyltransferase [Megamonas hypermegale]